MKLVLSSLFLDEEELYILKLAALYCDQIVVPSEGMQILQVLAPFKVGPGAEEATVPVRFVRRYSSTSREIEAAMLPLVREGILLRAGRSTSTARSVLGAVQDVGFVYSPDKLSAKSDEQWQAFTDALADILPNEVDPEFGTTRQAINRTGSVRATRSGT